MLFKPYVCLHVMLLSHELQMLVSLATNFTCTLAIQLVFDHGQRLEVAVDNIEYESLVANGSVAPP